MTDPLRRFTRRNFVRVSALAGAVALFAPLEPAAADKFAPTTAQKKDSKEEAEYQPSPKGEQYCSKCRFFMAEKQACQRVEGKIAPNAWCKYFSPKPA